MIGYTSLTLSLLVITVRADCQSSISMVALKGYTIRSFYSPNIHECNQECKQEVKCQSTNYNAVTSVCEMNNRTISQKPWHAKKDVYSAYFSKLNGVPLGSLESVPAISCQEIKNTSSNVISGYFWLLNEQTLKPTKEYCNMTLGVVDKCKPSPCQNNGTCVNEYEGRYKCVCPSIYTGIHCQNKIVNGTCLSEFLNGKISGIYSFILQGQPQDVYCDMNRDSGGWTLIARFSDSDTKNWMRNDGRWWYDIMTAQGSTTSTAVNQDMISPAFWSVKGNEIKITRSDDSSHTALLQTTSNCLGFVTFRSMITSFGDFRNGTVWSSNKCLGSCSVVYGGQYTSTNGFSQAHCSSGIQSSNKIGFWCDYGYGDGAVMMIGGGGSACARADHGIGITEEDAASFVTATVECDFGDVVRHAGDNCTTSPYALNLWIR